ncbi:T9SS type A sorting domain-containing protein [candidate division KSB1 bacterium]|nr:T9SS type A sorting domain-containing protein [candidate division KSB1 bacterium]
MVNRLYRTVGILFALCLMTQSSALGQKWRIMPVGDSITEGVGDTPEIGYRDNLVQYLQNRGISFTFVGPDGSAPNSGFFRRAMHIEDFLDGGRKVLSPEIMNQYQPNLIILHIGTNNEDFPAGPYSSDGGTSFNETAGGLLGQLVKYLCEYANGPRGTFLQRIIISKIPPRLDSPGFTMDYNAEIDRMFFDSPPGFITSRITIANSVITTSDIRTDGIHPGPDGYSRMANEFGRLIVQLDSRDTSDPGIVQWLSLAPLDDQSVGLRWQAAGDDGNSGQSNLSELRYAAFDFFADGSNFSSGKLVSQGKPATAGQSETDIVSGLLPGLTYYFGIRAWDEWNNRGPLSVGFVQMPQESSNEFCDDFCENTLGISWSAPPVFVIDEGLCELVNTSTISSWGNYLAVFDSVSYSSNIGALTTKLKWSDTVTKESGGMYATGLAMMLDSPDYRTANGYILTVRPDNIYLNSYISGQLTVLMRSPMPSSFDPAPGSEFKVIYNYTQTKGHTFSIYVDNIYLGQVNDSNRMLGNEPTLYSGIMLYGNINNNVDYFCVELTPLEASQIVAGSEPESGKIGSQLASPLVVYAQDLNGIGVSNVFVDFSVVSGQAFLSTDSIESKFNGNIWIEAESGKSLDRYMTSGDLNASGAKFVYVPLISGNYGQGLISYDVYVPQTGQYTLWARVLPPNNSSNSCFISVNGSSFAQWDFGDDGKWNWYKLTNQPFSLQKGLNRLEIKNREPDTRIDRLLLTRSTAYSPSGMGDANQTEIFSNISSNSGAAFTKVNFGTEAGAVRIRATAPSLTSNNQVYFDLFARAQDPQSMEYASPIVIAGVAGQSLTTPFAVELTDPYGNKCIGVQVEFAVTSGDGLFGGESSIVVASSENGIARATLSLGYDPDPVRVVASIPDHPELGSLEFVARKDNGPASVVYVAGNNQHGTVNRVLAEALQVRVLDTDNAPFTGAPVRFSVLNGDGKVNGFESVIDTTDASGIASVVWTLGHIAGTANQLVRVSVPFSPATLDFVATADPDIPVLLKKISGDNQETPAGFVFSDSLKVQVLDQYQNGVPGYTIHFTITAGDANFASQSARDDTTNSQGLAAVLPTAGRTLGTAQISAVGVPPLSSGGIVFNNLKIVKTQAAQITIVSGQNLTGIAGATLPTPLVVQVTDPFGTPVKNESIRFKVIEGGGHFAGQDSVTLLSDDSGRASATFTLGTLAGSRSHKVHVYTENPLITPALFTLSAEAGAAFRIEADPPGETSFSAKAGQGPIPIRVKVRDVYNNPKPGQDVDFYSLEAGTFEGNAGYQRLQTDANGNAIVNFTMGTNPLRPERIEVKSYRPSEPGINLQGSPLQFTGTYIPGDPARLLRASGDGFAGTVSTTLDSPFVVQAVDAFDLPSRSGIRIHFRIKNGDGRIANTQDFDTETDSEGKARVFLTLGPLAGILNNVIEAQAVDFPSVAPIEFHASATADVADQILFASDSTWNAAVHAQLPVAVKIADIRGNAIAQHPVKFYVGKGGGTVANRDTVTVQTSSNGVASVTWELGDRPGQHTIYAQAHRNGTLLNHAPRQFSAEAVAADPWYTALVSAENDTGIIGQLLADPLRVKITDKYDNPITGHPVQFSVYSGNGRFTGAASPTSLTVQTDSQGMAETYFQLGSTVGQNLIEIQSFYQGRPLINRTNNSFSSIIVFVWGIPTEASRLVRVSSSLIDAMAGSPIAVQAQVVDQNGNPVKDHPVHFQILNPESDSYFDSPDRRYSVKNSDPDGFAEAVWTLGTHAGTRTDSMQISSSNALGALTGSPLRIEATVLPAAPLEAQSRFTVTSPTQVNTRTPVMVVLADAYGNPVYGRMVQLQLSGQGNILEQPTTATDSQGRAFGAVLSSQAGEKTLIATVVGQPNFELQTLVLFTPGTANNLRIASGQNQTGNRGTVLPQALSVQAIDSFGNPVPDVAVTFSIQAGNGRFVENNLDEYTIATDAGGVASARLVLGTQADVNNIVFAAGPGIAQTQTFSARSVQSSPARIEFVDSTVYSATVADTLKTPLRVRVLDASNRPVYDAAVEFLTTGEGEILTADPRSDYEGIARTIYLLGCRAGEQQVQARLNGSSLLTFSIHGSASAAARMSKKSGDNQVGIVRTTLTQPFAVQIFDGCDNPKPDVPVIFQTMAGEGGTFSNSDTTRTDVYGFAYNLFTPGEQAGEYLIRVESPHLVNQSTIFRCQAKPDAAYAIHVHSGNQQRMTAGRELLQPIQVKVTDQWNNPVQNYVVSFVPIALNGSGPVGQVLNTTDTTDVDGIASCRWQLGAEPGSNWLLTGWGLKGYPLTLEAIGVANAYPTFVGLPTDTTLYYNHYSEGNPFELNIRAIDGDGDPLTIQVNGKPAAAQLLTVASDHLLMRWRPTSDDNLRVYQLDLTVRDNREGIGIHSLVIRVEGNTAPRVVSYKPIATELTLQKSETVLFAVTASDPDPGDVLTFQWSVNGSPVGSSGSQFVFDGSLYPVDSVYEVVVHISDGKESREMRWTLHLVTAVELSSFSADVEPYQGVRINWTTRSETQTAGFQVLRSLTPSGGFEPLSRDLLTPRADRTYHCIDTTTVAGRTYYYLLQDINMSGARSSHGPIAVELLLPQEFQVLQNYPNPFNPETQIRFQLPKAAKTRITVYNINGQTVRTLIDDHLEPGYHEISWNGTNDQGKWVGSGLYYYRIDAGNYSGIKKMALVR